MHVNARTLRFWIPLCVFLTAAGCSGESEDVGSETRLSAEVLYDRDDFGEPSDIAVLGPHLVVLDRLGPAPVLVLRAEDGSVARTFGRKGRGPGEFNTVSSILPANGSDSRFWVFDFNQRRLTEVDLAREPAAAPSSVRVVGLSSTGKILSGPAWVSDTLLLSPGIFDDAGRLARVNARGELLGFAGPSPPGAETVPMRVRQHAYQSVTSFNPRRGLLAVGTRHADRIEVYRPDGSLVRQWNGAGGFEPLYTVATFAGTPTFAGSDEMVHGYVDVATTEKHVYGLFSGRTRKEHGGRSSYGEQVHVFDWDGKLQRVFRLDQDVIDIAVPEDEHTLYAVVPEPEPKVVKYRLR